MSLSSRGSSSSVKMASLLENRQYLRAWRAHNPPDPDPEVPWREIQKPPLSGPVQAEWSGLWNGNEDDNEDLRRRRNKLMNKKESFEDEEEEESGRFFSLSHVEYREERRRGKSGERRYGV